MAAQTAVVKTTLAPAIAAELEQAAAADRRSVASLLRILIEDHLTARRDAEGKADHGRGNR